MKTYRLFTPGPVDIPEVILSATAKPCIYHREEMFRVLLTEITDALRKVVKCSGRVFFLTSSGTGAMETACVNILSSTDHPIVAVCGKFGERWCELCKAYRITPTIIKEEFGRSVAPEAIESALKKSGPAVVFTTLTETSTGALNDIQAFGEITRKYDSYLVVDGVAGVGADLCNQDEWNVDVLIGASQKALMSPPGAAFLSISDRAFEKTRVSDLPKYYFSLLLYEKFLEKGQTPWTPAITVLYGVKKGLSLIVKHGVAKNFQKHREMARYVRQRLVGMGLAIFPEHPSNALSVGRMPEGLDSTGIIKKIKEKYGILFANGQAEMKGKILRVGHMGNYSVPKLGRALDILERVLKKGI